MWTVLPALCPRFHHRWLRTNRTEFIYCSGTSKAKRVKNNKLVNADRMESTKGPIIRLLGIVILKVMLEDFSIRLYYLMCVDSLLFKFNSDEKQHIYSGWLLICIICKWLNAMFMFRAQFFFFVWTHVVYALCQSYHSNTKAVLFSCLSSEWVTTTDRLLGPKMGNSIKCLSQERSGALSIPLSFKP